jgi:beta-exotoxin I transport system permease protein
MLSTLFGKRLWDRRRTIVWWLVGIAALVLVTVAFYPTISDQRDQYAKLFEGMKDVSTMFGVDDIAEITEPAGYVTSQIYANVFPIVLLVFGIGFGTAAIAGEEDRGTMDLLLTLPISRRSIVLQSLASLAVLIGVLCTAVLVVLLATSSPAGLDLSLTGLLAVTVGSWLLGMAFGTLALAVGAATGRRGVTIGVSAGVAVGTFFVFGLAPLSATTEFLQAYSPFYWFLGGEPLADGFDPMFLGLVVLVALLVAVALWTFERRDILS